MDTLLRGATVLTMDKAGTIIPNGSVRVRDGKIVEVGPSSSLTAGPGVEVIDATDCVVMPGMVNAHTHSPMTLLRGYAEDLPLFRWLTEKIFPVEQKYVSPEFVKLGTELACLEMIRSGTTFFNDMYFFADIVGSVAAEAGMRAVCGLAFIEMHPIKDKEMSMEDRFGDYLEKLKPFQNVYPALAPHAVYTVSRQNFEKLAAFAQEKNLLVHLHLSETDGENEDCIKAQGMTPTEYLASLGFWKTKAIAAHATCLTEKDIAILGEHKVGISHNPESNLKLGTKICPVARLQEAGCPVALGTDSVASNNNLDLFQEIDTAAKVSVFREGAGRLPVEKAVRMLTSDGAAAMRMADHVGSLEVGKAADLIVVDVSAPHAIPLYNPYTHLVYSASGSDVRDTMVAGKWLMRSRKVLTLDEKEILKKAKAFGARIAKGE